MLVDTKDCSYFNKNRGGPQKTTYAHYSFSSTFEQFDSHNTFGPNDQSTKIIQQSQVSPSSSSTSFQRYTILKHMATIKVDATLLDMAIIFRAKRTFKKPHRW
jgi:hypothetical protein